MAYNEVEYGKIAQAPQFLARRAPMFSIVAIVLLLRVRYARLHRSESRIEHTLEPILSLEQQSWSPADTRVRAGIRNRNQPRILPTGGITRSIHPGGFEQGKVDSNDAIPGVFKGHRELTLPHCYEMMA